MSPMLKRAFYKLSFLLLVYLLFAFGFDPVLRWALVKAGERAAGAKVEIAGLDTGLFPPKMELEGVAVADAAAPMRNAVEFERAAFALEGGALLQKKFVVGEASLTGLRFSTARKSSGAIPALAEKKQEAAVGPTLTQKLTAQTTSFSLEKVGQAKEGLKETYAFKKEDLESYKLADSLKDSYAKKSEEWQKKLAAADFDGRAARLQQEYDKAQAETDKLRKIKQFQALLKESKKLSDDAKEFERTMKEDLGKAREDLKAVQEARRRDTELILSKLKLPTLDAQSLSEFLLGPEMAAKVQNMLGWIQWARAKMPPGGQKPQPPQRGKGVNVPFPLERSYPQLAIRLLNISGELPMAGGRPLAYSGKATGITTEQALLGQPMEVHLASERRPSTSLRAGNAFHADVILDHRAEPAQDSIDVGFEGIAMDARTLGSADSVAVAVSPGTAGVSARVAATGDALDGKIVFSQRGVALTPAVGAKGGGELVRRVATSAFSGLDRFEAAVTVKGTLQKPDFGVSSSLGRALADGLKKALGGELEARRKDIEGRVNTLVGEKTDAVQKTIEDKQGPLLAKLGKHGGIAKDLDKKLQDAIDSAQKSILPGGKLPDLKKKLFK